MPDCLSQLRALIHDNRMTLTDEKREFSGVIYKSADLRSLSTMFTYEAMGYSYLLEKELQGQRAPVVEYNHGKIETVREAVFSEHKDFDLLDLESDLVRFEPVYKTLFERFGYEVASFMGPRFEMRLMPLAYKAEYFHFDDDFIIALQPMGDGVDSTVCKDSQGNRIDSKSGEMVVTTPALEHSWPATDKPRLGLAATLYRHHLL